METYVAIEYTWKYKRAAIPKMIFLIQRQSSHINAQKTLSQV